MALQVFTYRRERAVKPRRIVIGQTAAFISMVAFSIITLRPPGPGVWVVLLGVGIGGGSLYARFVNVRTGEKGVTMSYTLPWLITWGTLMAMTQLTAVVAQSVPVIIYSLAIVNLGINLGMNGRILGTYRTLSASTVAALLGFAVLGLAALGPAVPGLAQPNSDDLPPEIESVIVAGGGTTSEGSLRDGEFWNEAPGTPVVGAYISFGYTADWVQFVQLLDSGEWFQNETFNIIQVAWFRNGTDAGRAFEAWTIGDSGYRSAWDLGFGLPTVRLDRPSEGGIAYGETFVVQKGNAVVQWMTSTGDTATNPNSPGGLAGTEHLAAIVANVQNIDVDALRSSWHGTTDAEPAAPPADSADDSEVSDNPGSGDTASGDETTQGASGAVDPTQSSVLPGDAGTSNQDPDPLDPVRSAAATAIAGIILAGGSLLQLTDRFDPAAIVEVLNDMRRQAPLSDPVVDLSHGDNDLVLAQMPWDEAGPAWVSKEDAKHALDMQANGYSWDKRWGWVQDGDAAHRQANVDLGRDQWLARDPVADRIVSDIVASREDLARKLAEMNRAEKIEDIRHQESQAMIDAWNARIADNRYNWWSGVSIASDVVFGVATGGLASVKPIGQLALRAGMHMTSGYAQGWSENELDGRSWDSQAFARGSAIGFVRAAVDFGTEGALGAARKVLPIARNALSRLRGTGELSENLVRAKGLVTSAVEKAEHVVVSDGLEAGLKAVDSEAALELLREGTRLRAAGASLADLEASGSVTREQAQLLRQVWTDTFDESAEAGAKEVFGAFEQRYGDGLREVLLGDQGSSSTRFAVGSLKTDADRTVLPVFESGLLERVAGETGETIGQVNTRLTDEVTELWRTATGNNLRARNLTLDDFDAGSYSGFGRSVTANDAYDANWVMQRQHSGTTMVVRAGDAATYRAGGEAIVDQARLNAHLTGAADASMDAARVSTDSALAFLGDQAEVVAGAADVKTAAKGFARQAWAAGRQDVSAMAGTAPDSELSVLANALLKEPQQQLRLLQEAGYTPTSFVESLQAESLRLMDSLRQ